MVARGRVLPSGNLSVGTKVVINGNDVTINLDRIDDGATITLTYELKGRDTDDEVDPLSLITVPTAVPGSGFRCLGFHH